MMSTVEHFFFFFFFFKKNSWIVTGEVLSSNMRNALSLEHDPNSWRFRSDGFVHHLCLEL
jgi:hypothetical protein